MTEVANGEYVVLYVARCPVCKRVYVSLSKPQLVSNIIYHTKRHKQPPDLNSIHIARVLVKVRQKVKE